MNVNPEQLWSQFAEAATLASMMMEPEFIPAVMEHIGKDDFFDPNHATIFEMIMRRYIERDGIDPLLIRQDLSDKGLIKPPLTLEYLERMLATVPSPALAGYYAKQVAEKSKFRKVLGTLQEVSSMAEDGEDVETLVETLAERAIALTSREAGKTVTVSQEVLGEVILSLENNTAILPTGYRKLDHAIGGFAGGEVCVIAGRPGMGKSAFALGILMRMKRRALLVTLEMPPEQIIQRMIAGLCRVDISKILRRYDSIEALNTKQFHKMFDACNGNPFDWLTITNKATTIPKLIGCISQHKPEIVVVDHIGLMSGPGQRIIDRITELSRQLKLLAGETGVPFIVLSQLNRGVEGREDKRPRMSDLRESGAIEQDADLILMLYREGYYNRDPENATVECLITKNRRGECYTVEMVFNSQYVSFEDKAEESPWMK